MNRPLIWHNQTVLVMGLGQFGGGVGAARYAVSQGAKVVVTDMAGSSQLEASLQPLAGLPIEYRLGEHLPSDFEQADIVIVNPAVDAANNRYLKMAREHGAKITSEIRLLVQQLPNSQRIIAVTGTAGKSTTTAMIGHILEALGQRVFVGGNLGGSLLNTLETIGPNDWVVLELSSFMLENLDEDHRSAHIAVVTNMTPNHLDRHRTLEHYTHAKQTILRYQTQQDVAILPDSLSHWHTLGTKVVFSADDFTGSLALPGQHNRLNAAAAIKACQMAMAEQAGASGGGASGVSGVSGALPSHGQPDTQLQDVLADFHGLPHRLQWVCTFEQVRYFNDSKSTTPASAMLGIRSFEPGIVHVLLGGHDKQSDLRELAAYAKRHCKAIYTLGQTGDALTQFAQQAPGSGDVVACQTLDNAMSQTASRIGRGDVVLLSPGCASWDQFENYEARGNAFVQAILKYTGEGALPPTSSASPF